MKRYEMEISTPKIGFHGSIQIIRELDVDDIVINIAGSLTTCSVSRNIATMIYLDRGCLIVSILRPHVVGSLSRLPEMNFFLPFILIGQHRRFYWWVRVNVHTIIHCYSLVINSRGAS